MLSYKEIQDIHDTYHKRMGPQEFARAVIAAERKKFIGLLEDIADGFMSVDPTDNTKNMQYYGSHIRGVLRHRAEELRQQDD